VANQRWLFAPLKRREPDKALIEFDWEALFEEWQSNGIGRPEARPPKDPFEVPEDALRSLAEPTSSELFWLVSALRLPQRRWFIATVTHKIYYLGEELFLPLLTAGIEEPNPSFNNRFIAPCLWAFGHRRVNEHLLKVLADGSHSEKVGAVGAMYWANVSFARQPLPLEVVSLRRELEDVWERKRVLLLETFVLNSDLKLRQRIVSHLELAPKLYPESHRHLIDQAVDIARSSEDKYLKDRIESQLRESHLLPSVPDPFR
jgi:hypothetical protein